MTHMLSRPNGGQLTAIKKVLSEIRSLLPEGTPTVFGVLPVDLVVSDWRRPISPNFIADLEHIAWHFFLLYEDGTRAVCETNLLFEFAMLQTFSHEQKSPELERISRALLATRSDETPHELRLLTCPQILINCVRLVGSNSRVILDEGLVMGRHHEELTEQEFVAYMIERSAKWRAAHSGNDNEIGG